MILAALTTFALLILAQATGIPSSRSLGVAEGRRRANACGSRRESNAHFDHYELSSRPWRRAPCTAVSQ